MYPERFIHSFFLTHYIFHLNPNQPRHNARVALPPGSAYPRPDTPRHTNLRPLCLPTPDHHPDHDRLSRFPNIPDRLCHPSSHSMVPLRMVQALHGPGDSQLGVCGPLSSRNKLDRSLNHPHRRHPRRVCRDLRSWTLNFSPPHNENDIAQGLSDGPALLHINSRGLHHRNADPLQQPPLLHPRVYHLHHLLPNLHFLLLHPHQHTVG